MPSFSITLSDGAFRPSAYAYTFASPRYRPQVA